MSVPEPRPVPRRPWASTSGVVRWGCAFLIAALPSTAAGSPEDPLAAAEEPAASVDDLAWFAGTWVGTIGGDPIEVAWLEPAGGAIVGVFRWIKQGEVYLYELLAIRPDPDGGGLVLALKHFGADLRGWEAQDESVIFDLVEAGDGRAVFAQRGRPTRLTYRLDGPDRLTATLETERGGQPVVMEFRYGRR